MNLLELIGSMPLARALGWALLHFLWEGALIAAVVAAGLRGLRGAGPNARYLLCCAGLAGMLLAPAVTVLVAWPAPPPVPATAALMAGAGGDVAPGLAARLEPLLPALTMVWLLGVFVLQARLVLHWSHARHLRRYGHRPAPAAWTRAVDDLAAALGLRRRVSIVESSLAAVPMVIGWLRPVILVPACAVSGLTPAELRTVIAHELSHVRRHDYLVNLVQSVLETLLFYHPSVWWLSERLRAEREYCCDDAAVSVCGDRLCYARALSRLDTLRDDAPSPVLASTGGSLMNRIGRLADTRAIPAPRTLGGWVAPALLAIFVTAAGSAMAVRTVVRTDDDTKPPQDVRPIDRIDLAGILGELGDERSGMFAVLRDSGLDNATLLTVLRELGAEENVFHVIEREAHRAHVIESHMGPLRDRVAAGLAAGELSAEEAELRLELARLELETEFAERQARHERVGDLERRMMKIHDQVATDLEAGLIDEREAHARLEKAAAELHAAMGGKNVPFGAKLRLRVHEHELELHAVEDQIAEDLELGRITADEAEVRRHDVADQRQAIDDEMAREEEMNRRHGVLERRVKAAHEEIRHLLRDGAITEAEASDRLAAVKEQIHGELRDAHLIVERAEGEARVKLAVDDAREHEVHKVEVEFAAMKDELAAAVARGEMTEEAMRARLDEAGARLKRAHVRLRKQAPDERVAFGTVVELAPLDASAAPEMKARIAELRRHLDAARQKRLREPTLSDERAALKGRLLEIEAQAHRDFEAGLIDEEQFVERLEAARREFTPVRERPARKLNLSDEERRALLDRIAAARATLEDQIDAGEIGPEQARKRLDHLAEVEKALGGS